MSKEHNPKHTNELIHASSPYLLQHAHNPVNWVSWSEKAFEQAKKEDKLVLISIGYSACHWCHVMEREAFEKEHVAKVMNEHFICIKVDREERPDVDQVYMAAVQIMTNQGGWPLNCFALPDGSPVYGGTYFPQDQWIHILESLAYGYKNERQHYTDYALRLKEGVQQSELIEKPVELALFASHLEDSPEEKLHELVSIWKHRFDKKDGGNNQAPKFPLPNNYLFLLRYGVYFQDESVKQQVNLTLTKMAQGGIFDQIGGGFSRYSVDGLWKVPHFEKMLYDNGQLLSLYSQAFSETKNIEYQTVVEKTITWLKREMKSDFGCYFSALDADSEGIEGKFYVWTEEELETILGQDFAWFSAYYNVNEKGYWEDENYILLRNKTVAEFALENNINEAQFNLDLESINDKLLQIRNKRIAPGLDDKSLTSWNALLITGFADAYKAFGNEQYKTLALEIATWIEKYQLQENGQLFHSFKNGIPSINGFLEDYAFVIQAWLELYSITFDEKWIFKAEKLMEYSILHFGDAVSQLFFFTDKNTELIARKMEINDNVIVSSNSQMANNLFVLGKLIDNETYIQRAKQMLANVYEGIENYGSGYSNWAYLLMNFTTDFYEIVVTGKEFEVKIKELYKPYLPHCVFVGAENTSRLELTKGRFENTETAIYVCKNKTCQLPVFDGVEALNLLRQ